jgi:peptidoglycan/LPS O-acetylase OafA/YrhL
LAVKRPIDSLTGLRAIAAMMVAVTHYTIWCAPFPINTVPHNVQAIAYLFGLADYGMTLFFTLSGFVITYNYLDFGWAETPLSSLYRFVVLRLSRLYPALLLFLVIVLVAQSSWEGHAFRIWTALHFLSIETIIPAIYQNVLPVNSVFFVSWSIGTEIFLYVFFAVTTIFTLYLGYSRQYVQSLFWGLLIAIGVGLLALTFSDHFFETVTSRLPSFGGAMDQALWRRWFFYCSPYYRILDFACGSVVAMLVLRCPDELTRRRALLRWLALGAVGIVLALHADIHAFHFSPRLDRADSPEAQLITAVCFALIMLNGEDATALNRFLESRVLVFIGEISFSLYLFHYLAPRLISPQWTNAYDPTLVPVWIFNILFAGFLAVAFAYGTYSLVERPAQNWLRRALLPSRRRPDRRAAAAANADAERQGIAVSAVVATPSNLSADN